jgi:hypothetical protein
MTRARHVASESETDFLRALGGAMAAAARLEALRSGGTPIVEDDVRASWGHRTGQLLAERDRILDAIGLDTDATSLVRVPSVDGSTVAVDVRALELLAERLGRHRSAGLALGIVTVPLPLDVPAVPISSYRGARAS